MYVKQGLREPQVPSYFQKQALPLKHAETLELDGLTHKAL